MSFLGVVTTGFFLLVAVSAWCGFELGRGRKRELRQKEGTPWDLTDAAALLEAELESFRKEMGAVGRLPSAARLAEARLEQCLEDLMWLAEGEHWQALTIRRESARGPSARLERERG